MKSKVKPTTRSPLHADTFASLMAPEAAERLIGATLLVDGVGGRIVETEAYDQTEPASHTFIGRTPRNAVMSGPAGRLYVYFVYGMHFCANVTCLEDGVSGAVLLRAGEVVSDLGLAHTRRPTARGRDAELARGPARLCTLLGLDRSHNGVDVLSPASPVRLEAGPPLSDADVRTGPRVGVAAGQERPWRFWVAGSPAVTPYKAGRARPDGPDW